MAVFAAVRGGGGEANPKKEKRRIQVSIDMEELYRLCKMAMMVLALASLFALVLYFYPSLSSPPRPSLSSIIVFLLINAVVMSLAMSSGMLKSSNTEEKMESSMNIVGEKIPLPSLFLSSQAPDSPCLLIAEGEKKMAENLRRNRNGLGESRSFRKRPQLQQQKESEDSGSFRKLPQLEQELEDTQKQNLLLGDSGRFRKLRRELENTQNRNLVGESGSFRALPQLQQEEEEEKEEEYTQNCKISLRKSSQLERELEENATEFEEDEVDRKAEDFIGKFYQQLKMQRLESLLRYRATTET